MIRKGLLTLTITITLFAQLKTQDNSTTTTTSDGSNNSTTQNSNTNTTTQPTSTSSTIEITGSQAEYTTIPTIIIAVEGVTSIYNLMFDNLPEDQTGEQKSTLDQIQEGLETYKKVRNFVVVMTSQRTKLLEDLNYIKNNIGDLGLSKYEVLGFYDLRDNYEILIKNFKAYDPAFQRKDEYMDKEVEEYLQDIANIVKSVDTIMELEKVIWDKTKDIRDDINNNAPVNAALNTIDGILLLMLDLLTYRKQILLELEVTRPSLLDLEYKRERFVQILTDQKIFIGVNHTTNQTIFAGRLLMSSLLALFALLI